MTPDDALELCRRVYATLDWRAMGAVYFHEDGEALLRERRAPLIELGGMLANALVNVVPKGGASLWVGAGLVELPVIIAELAVAGRTVHAANLREAECQLLNSALRSAAPDLGLVISTGDARQLAADLTFDHIGCISVFTDPETWPVLSDVAYGRVAPVQLDVEAFAAEREQARLLATELFARLARPGWVTTSAEEAPWFLEAATAAGVDYDAGDELIETALVGDPVGFLHFQ